MRRQASLFLAGGIILALAQVGCDGSYQASAQADAATDGGARDATAAGGSGGTAGRRDGGTAGAGGTTPTRAKPVINPAARKFVAGQSQLVGSTSDLSACSQPVPPAGDRWCAFYQPGQKLGTVELWVIDSTKAATGAVKCDGTDPNCKLLSDDLWTGQPGSGPGHPTAHRFTGDTLIYYSGADVSADIYQGKVWAWRPGWAQPRAITDDKGVLCFAHPRAAVAACIGNLPASNTDPFTFDLFAGPLRDAVDARLPKVDRIFPNDADGNSKWSAEFSPSGELFAYSTGLNETDVETLYVMKATETADATKRIKVQEPARGQLIGGATQFQFSADGTQVYYLRDLDAAAEVPIGTLVSADAATGLVKADVRANVAAFSVLAGDPGAKRGIALYHDVTRTGATFTLLKDPANPASAVTLADKVIDVTISKDHRFAYYARNVDGQTGLTDSWVTELDGPPTPCSLQPQLRTTTFGAPFTDDSSLVFWVDKVDLNTFTGEGWYARPGDCSGKAKFADGLDYWFTSGKIFAYTDAVQNDWATLRVATLDATGGWPATGPVKLQEGADRSFALTQPELGVAVFAIATNFPDVNGLYAIRVAAGAASSVDGGSTPPPIADAGVDGP